MPKETGEPAGNLIFEAGLTKAQMTAMIDRMPIHIKFHEAMEAVGIGILLGTAIGCAEVIHPVIDVLVGAAVGWGSANVHFRRRDQRQKIKEDLQIY
jgi:hypothetical protein